MELAASWCILAIEDLLYKSGTLIIQTLIINFHYLNFDCLNLDSLNHDCLSLEYLKLSLDYTVPLFPVFKL